MAELKRCPCGKVPTSISTVEQGRYSIGTPNCCSEWMFEFRSSYAANDKLEALAVAAWNALPRPQQSGAKCVCAGLAQRHSACYEYKGPCLCCDPPVCEWCGHDRACHGVGGGQ